MLKQIFDKIVRSDKGLYCSFENLNLTKFSIFLNRINDIKNIHLDLEMKKIEQRVQELKELRCKEKFQSNLELYSVSNNLNPNNICSHDAVPINCKKLSAVAHERRSYSIPKKIIIRLENKISNKSDSKNSYLINLADQKNNRIREIDESSPSFDSESEENQQKKKVKEQQKENLDSSNKAEYYPKLVLHEKPGEFFKRIYINKNSKLNEIIEKFNKK